MSPPLLLLLFFLAKLTLSDASVESDGLHVKTRLGPVSGSRPIPGVLQWLGIPYAVAGRWEAPRFPESFRSTFPAASFGDACPQLINPIVANYLVLSHQNDSIRESEDCLTLNIWTPSRRNVRNTPVLIWIHGGGFQFGTSGLKVYDAKRLVQSHDVTVVTINYRLNIFGQPGAPQLVNPNVTQNFGLLDQRAAVQWVFDNIASFGGDPAQITLVGHSAGATSLALYTLAYPNDTLVKGLIEQSGSVYDLSNAASPTFDDGPWRTVAGVVGCGTEPTPDQLTCMKTIPWRDIIATILREGIPFVKLVTDDVLVFSNYQSRTEAGQFLRVPALTGSLANDLDTFTVAANLARRGNSPPFLTQVISDISTQVTITCPVSTISGIRAGLGVPTWRYYYEAIFPGISTRSDLRAFHSSEIPLIFGTYRDISSSSSPEETALSNTIQAAWVAFAKNPTSGLTSLNWPKYDPSSDTLVQLGNRENQTGISFAPPRLLDATCDSIPKLLELRSQFSNLLSGV
ncbi:carboxylesterase [Coprinopsis marcescibilis]|uniref:Carboxylic ester hydrolase n=1 Tax=Coprinopsis marcescibilis TaxID=230819 RepID=A0A5C3L0X5_COPMA|nr:carboxylesterase [Coprinopsis marcescibilis]